MAMPAPSPSPFDALKPLAGRALQAALNRALSLDPQTASGLDRLEGRQVVLRLDAPVLALALTIRQARFHVGPVDDAAEPDLAVRTTLGGLLGQLPLLRRSGAAPVGRMRIEGDAELARTLQEMARHFDPDWAQPFAAVFGDVIGVQVAQALAAGLRQAASAGRELAENAAGFVVEESRDVVGRDELDAFFDDVDVVRDDVERLTVRVARLRSARAPGP